MTAVVAPSAFFGVPETYDIKLGTASATGQINVGDWLLFSGSYVYAGSSYTPANKASGAGVALQSNPTYDSRGAVVTATGLIYLREGIIRVSAYTGTFQLGTPVWPSATGSGIAAPTGKSGVGAIWAAAAKVSINTANAAGTGAEIAFATGIATVVGRGTLTNGSAEIDVLIRPVSTDYY